MTFVLAGFLLWVSMTSDIRLDPAPLKSVAFIGALLAGAIGFDLWVLVGVVTRSRK